MSKSKTFDEIKRIVIKYDLNDSGFKVRDILDRTQKININTARNFIPKHARIKELYFERVGKLGRGVYKIRPEFL